MQPVASPLTMTCATADPLTPALRALGPVRVRPFRCHSSRGPEFTAGILLWHAHTCQGNNKVERLLNSNDLSLFAPRHRRGLGPLRALLDGPGLPAQDRSHGVAAPRLVSHSVGPARPAAGVHAPLARGR